MTSTVMQRTGFVQVTSLLLDTCFSSRPYANVLLGHVTRCISTLLSFICQLIPGMDQLVKL